MKQTMWALCAACDGWCIVLSFNPWHIRSVPEGNMCKTILVRLSPTSLPVYLYCSQDKNTRILTYASVGGIFFLHTTLKWFIILLTCSNLQFLYYPIFFFVIYVASSGSIVNYYRHYSQTRIKFGRTPFRRSTILSTFFVPFSSLLIWSTKFGRSTGWSTTLIRRPWRAWHDFMNFQ